MPEKLYLGTLTKKVWNPAYFSTCQNRQDFRLFRKSSKVNLFGHGNIIWGALWGSFNRRIRFPDRQRFLKFLWVQRLDFSKNAKIGGKSGQNMQKSTKTACNVRIEPDTIFRLGWFAGKTSILPIEDFKCHNNPHLKRSWGSQETNTSKKSYFMLFSATNFPTSLTFTR